MPRQASTVCPPVLGRGASAATALVLRLQGYILWLHTQVHLTSDSTPRGHCLQIQPPLDLPGPSVILADQASAS